MKSAAEQSGWAIGLSVMEIRADTFPLVLEWTRSTRIFDENITADGAWISSAAQRRKIMDREGLEYKDKFRNTPKGGRGLFFDMKAR